MTISFGSDAQTSETNSRTNDRAKPDAYINFSLKLAGGATRSLNSIRLYKSKAIEAKLMAALDADEEAVQRMFGTEYVVVTYRKAVDESADDIDLFDPKAA